MNRTGRIERIDYTQGGAGNQWTWIGGVRYATWWDISAIDWTLGDQVQFRIVRAPLWSGQPDVLQAHDIVKVKTP
jgi:hypothetical protein